MKDIYVQTCTIKESDGKQRISEYRYSGVVDDEGNFKLKGCFGRIYSVEIIGTNKTECNESPIISREIA